MSDVAYISNNTPSDADLLQQKLRDDHSTVLARAQELIIAADRVPTEISDDETAGKAADFIKQVTASQKVLESVRVNEKEPYLTLGRIVDGFFKAPHDALTIAKAKASRPLDAHLKRKADEERRAREEAAREARRIAEEQLLAARAMERAKQTEAAQSMADQAQQTTIEAAKLERAAEAKPAELTHARGATGARAALRMWWVGEVVDVATLDLQTLRHHIHPEALQKAVNSFVQAGGRDLVGANIYEKSEAVVR